MPDSPDLRRRNRRLTADKARLLENLADSSRLAAISRLSRDAILLLDLDGNILEWNDSAERLYGYSQQEAQSLNIRDLVPESGTKAITRLLEQARDGRIPESSFEAQRVTRGGRTMDVWVSIAGLYDENGRLSAIAASDRDITDRKRSRTELRTALARLELRMARRTQSLELLRDIASMANETENLTDVLDHALQRVALHAGWCAGRALLQPERGHGLTTVAAWSRDTISPYRDFTVPAGDANRGSGPGLPDRVVEERRVLWSDDPGSDVTPMSDTDAGAGRTGCRVAFPLTSRGVVTGVLEFLSDKPIRLTSQQIDLLMSIGTQIGIAIEREQLKRRIEDIATREQTRLARDLHDAVGQRLAGLAMTTEVIARRLTDAGSPESESVGTLADGMRRALNDIRAMARGLVLIPVGPGILARLVRQLCLEHAGRFQAQISVDADTTIDVGDRKVATHLYRIAQEAVQNAVTHADARAIRVTLRRDGRCLLLSVVDDGRGFTDGPHEGIGLRSMQERARSIGALLRIDSAAGQGTSILCRAPLPQGGD